MDSRLQSRRLSTSLHTGKEGDIPCFIMKTTPAQRQQLDGILLRDILALEKAGFRPTSMMLATRYWPVWGKQLGLSGETMLSLVNRRLKSLKIEGWVSDHIYPRLPGSRAPAWGLTDAGLGHFGHRRGGPTNPSQPPPSSDPRHGQGSGYRAQPGGGSHQSTSGQESARRAPDTRPEVPRAVYEASVLLGVSPLASPEQIQGAYRSWAKSLHPDRNPNPQEAAEQLKRINGARDLLLEFLRTRAQR